MTNEAVSMKIIGVSDQTPAMRLVTLERKEPWPFIPGQVAILAVEGSGESYFALASAPEDEGVLQFLIKDGKGAAGALFRAKEGETVQVKGPVGKGFPIDDYKGRDVIIEAVGAAVAPMRSVIRSILKRRGDFRKVTAIFGVRLPQDFPFAAEMQEWQAAGIEITLTVSRPEGTDWTGGTGHVHAHCEAAMEGLEGPVALVCGMKEMMDQSKDELCRLGVDECDVLTNF